MTIPRISTMVTLRQRRCELVLSFVTTYRQDVAEALELLLLDDTSDMIGDTDDTDDTEVLPPGTLTAVLGRLLRRMKCGLGDLIEAEKKHLNELGNDAVPRKRRDDAVVVLRGVLFDLRRAYRGLYGRHKAQEMGFENRLAKDPLTLLRQGQRVHGYVSERVTEAAEADGVAEAEAGSSAGQADEPRYEGIEVSPERVQKLLEPYLDELHEAIADVREELGRQQGTKIAKDRAMEAFDETYLLIARMLVWAFRLAGRRELAAKLPTSLRRPSKKRAEAQDPP